ncbi:cell division protein FtsZ, partial [Cycloclasticus sp. 44_32_T64]
SLLNAFKAANDVLLGAVQGIAELITCPGLINVDFADVRTVMSEMGDAMMGTGTASGESRARDAAEAAIHSPLLEDINVQGARGILVNITAGLDMSIGEFEEVGQAIRDFASDDANVVVGTVIDPDLSDEMRVTVVATGLGGKVAAVEPTPIVQVKREPIKVAELNEEDLDIPTIMRDKKSAVASQKTAGLDNTLDPSYLDIPAFLRRQAD